ncbi:MAG: hypothetical protein MUF71_15810 [Candidatus Kapabacteria bacterium]|jgi:hypothetical protein|nr:hypothetical protein [Candidatus Kapabacteria bacterium]
MQQESLSEKGVVIDAREFSPEASGKVKELCNHLGCKAFFADTNILIDFRDQFSRSLDSAEIKRRVETIERAVNALKGSGIVAYSTLSTAIEYYKHIQHGFFRSYNQKDIPFKTDYFKELRQNDPDFAHGWNLQIKRFTETFDKKFPIYKLDTPQNLNVREMSSEVDFGDFALYAIVRHVEASNKYIFSNDGDFYNFTDVHLFTTNAKIINQAINDGRLYKQSK